MLHAGGVYQGRTYIPSPSVLPPITRRQTQRHIHTGIYIYVYRPQWRKPHIHSATTTHPAPNATSHYSPFSHVSGGAVLRFVASVFVCVSCVCVFSAASLFAHFRTSLTTRTRVLADSKTSLKEHQSGIHRRRSPLHLSRSAQGRGDKEWVEKVRSGGTIKDLFSLTHTKKTTKEANHKKGDETKESISLALCLSVCVRFYLSLVCVCVRRFAVFLFCPPLPHTSWCLYAFSFSFCLLRVSSYLATSSRVEFVLASSFLIIPAALFGCAALPSFVLLCLRYPC